MNRNVMSENSDTVHRADWTEKIIVTSEPEPPIETVARLFDTEAGPEQLTAAFADQGVTLEASDYFLEDKSRHQVHVGEAVEHVPCVADALQVAVLVDQNPVTIRSFDPVTDTPVTFEVGADSLDVDPATHVISIGVARDLLEALPEGMDAINYAAAVLGSNDQRTSHEGRPVVGEELAEVGLEHIRSVGCEYINAFESPETYQEWATEVDAVTMALRAEAIMSGTRAFVASPVFD